MSRSIITQTLLSAVVLTLGYFALVQFYHPLFHKAASQDITNRLYLENHVYGLGAPFVLAGSSLTQRLPENALGPDYQNLALSGDGSLTGLAVAVRAPHRPKRILVEINKIDRGLNQELVASIFGEPMFTLRRHIVALRVGYKPVNYLYGLLRGTTGGQGSEAAPVLDAAQSQAVMAETARSYASTLPRQAIEADVRILTALIAQARARGIEPVLYEMPIDPRFSHYPLATQIRAAVRLALPPDKICWLEIALPGGAHTFDGEHLIAVDSIALAGQLRQMPACEGR